jgi:hypothetical protein
MRYDEESTNTDEMAELMGRAQIAEANRRYDEAIALLNEVATKATDAEDRMFAAGTALLVFFHNFLNGNLPRIGTSEYETFYKYLKLTIDSYNGSHPSAQEMFRSNNDINYFNTLLIQMEKEIDNSRKAQNIEQHVGTSSLIYIYKNNQRFGPYEESAVRQWLQNGQCSLNDLGWRNGMKDWLPLSAFFPIEAKTQGLPDIRPYHAPAIFSFTLASLTWLDEAKIEGPISYLLTTNPEYKSKREQTKKEASRHLNTILATKIWSPYEITACYWFSADKTDTHLKLSFDLFTIPAPLHANYTVGRVHFETPLNAADGQIEKNWISIISEEEIKENIKMLYEE